MNKLLLSLLACSTFYSLPQFAGTTQLDVIYGEDNRQDVYAATDSVLVDLAKSTAAMIPSGSLKNSRDNQVQIFGKTLQERGVCAQERFSQQLTAAKCSGFLVAPNILVTAGHCIKTLSDCHSNKWVFDYKVEYANQKNVYVGPSSVYNCKKIISRSLDRTTKDDYAVIELDRNVTGRKPLLFRRSGRISKGAQLAVIGHPTGLPTKIADGAEVRSLAGKFFVANLDTYGGNSGSAVFNMRTFEVEGILVRGELDYSYDSHLGCKVSNRCSDSGCRGEDVTFITHIEALKNL